MVRAEVFSDELWALIEPVWPSPGVRAGHPGNDHRLTLEGIAWRYRVGAPWAGCAGGLRGLAVPMDASGDYGVNVLIDSAGTLPGVGAPVGPATGGSVRHPAGLRQPEHGVG
ncbi:transposase [Amycolatopsis sp. NBC_00355]|uniref:transposase n=1 Tax=Amycolatopsis sp. NBC_00355 TaxID=2975957 RepID=UPI003FA4762F